MAGTLTADPYDKGNRSVALTSSIEPDASKKSKDAMADAAFRDAVFLVALSWGVLFLLAYTLRHHNH